MKYCHSISELDTMEKKDLIRIILEQQERLKELENRLDRNSQNSNTPSSKDGFNKPVKPQSERKKSGKKSGGQSGHKGTTLKPVENPDVIKRYSVGQCSACAHDLSSIQETYEKRQEIDIPQVKPIVTEHHIATKICPECKTINNAGPLHLTQAVQYGSRVKTLASYMHYDQLIPLNRIQGMFTDIFSLNISEGTLVNMHEEVFTNLAAHENLIRTKLAQSETVHFDETGVVVNGKLHWMHSASTATNTAYFVHKNRGSKAIAAFDVLPQFYGIAVHDHWKSYFTYDQAQHSLCNAHHIRELRGIFENYNQSWAKEMRQHLLHINEIVLNAKASQHNELPQELLSQLSQKYDTILQNALSEIPSIKASGKRGKAKQHPAKNLHDRLMNYKNETLRFMYNFKAPFTNNQAESDIRMTKVKQKISGGFRSIEGANRFCRIRGYISTTRKQKLNVFQAINCVASQSPLALSP